MLPTILKNAIEKESGFSVAHLKQAREGLTARYRQGQPQERQITTELERRSYLLTRLPATYAVISEVFRQILLRCTPLAHVLSILDLGAGPGTAIWAACEHFPALQNVTAIEADSHFIALGKRLAEAGNSPVFSHFSWICQNLQENIPLPAHDLVILSYSIGEIRDEMLLTLMERAFAAANQMMIVIEPGTPAGFERIRRMRSHLIALGGYPVAPCPHASACPILAPDWCHFSVRLERSSLHRRLKGGSLSYEDEKFAYSAVAKSPPATVQDRIIAAPQVRSGHIRLKLCTQTGCIQQTIISKKQGPLYKDARKLSWGDSIR